MLEQAVTPGHEFLKELNSLQLPLTAGAVSLLCQAQKTAAPWPAEPNNKNCVRRHWVPDRQNTNKYLYKNNVIYCCPRPQTQQTQKVAMHKIHLVANERARHAHNLPSKHQPAH